MIIEVDDIDIDCEHFGAKSDFLEIRDGASESSPIIKVFCGDKSNTPAVMTTTQNNMRIRLAFHTWLIYILVISFSPQIQIKRLWQRHWIPDKVQLHQW